jgi:hypothetical protein
VAKVYGDPVQVGDAVEFDGMAIFGGDGVSHGKVKEILPDGTAVVLLRGGRKVTIKQTRLRFKGSSTPTEPYFNFDFNFGPAIAALVLPPAAVGAAVGAFAGSKYKKVGPYYGAGLGAVGALAATVLVTRFLNQPTKSPVPVLKVAGIESYDVDDLPTYLRQAFSEVREELGLEDLPAFGPWAPTEAEIEAISEAKRRSASARP